MAGSFPTIDWVYESNAGNILQVDAGVTVIAADDAGSTLDTFVTDTDGRVPADTVAGTVAGDIVFFRIENFHGLAGCVGIMLT